MVGLTSAAGLVGFLAEPDARLRTYALGRLNDEIDLLWPEVADSVGTMSVRRLAYEPLSWSSARGVAPWNDKEIYLIYPDTCYARDTGKKRSLTYPFLT